MRPYLFLFAFAAILLSGGVRAQVPKLVNYQGRVAVDAVNFEGAGQFKFALVSSNGTTTFWSNDGTSAGGSEPATAVTLVVTKGLYSVLLGDTALGNMTAIPAIAFANPDVRLRVWFNDGAHGSQLLTPDQRLAPVSYLADGIVTSASIGPAAVTSGKIAPGAVSGTNIAPASLTSSNFAVPNAPANGQVLGFNNGGLTWTAPGGGVFSFNGTSAYYNGGNVGIGSTAPVGKLEVVAQDALRLVGPQPFLTLLDSNASFARSRIQGFGGGMNLETENYVNGSDPSAVLTLAATGNVGIGGSPNPIAKLEVVGQDALRLIGFQPFLTLLDSNAGYARSRIQGVNGGIVFEPETFLNGSNPGAAMAITVTGLVGVGTTTPIAKFHSEINQANAVAVYGRSTGTSGIGVLGESSTGAAVRAEGNATQAHDKGGFAKAMLAVNQSGGIVRCYNGVTGSSTGGCGFVVTRPFDGIFRVTFPFQVSDRFFSVTAEWDSYGGFVGNRNAGANYRVFDATSVEVFTFQTDDVENTSSAKFMLIVY